MIHRIMRPKCAWPYVCSRYFWNVACLLLLTFVVPSVCGQQASLEHPGVTLIYQAMAESERGDFLTASAMLERSLALLEAESGADHGVTLVAARRLAWVSMRLGRFGKAEALLRRVIDTENRLQRPDAVLAAGAMSDLAVLYLLQRRPARAEPLAREALGILEAGEANSNSKGSALLSMAWVMLIYGRASEGIPYAERARDVLIKGGAPIASQLDAAATLGALYMIDGRDDASLSCLAQAVRDAESHYGADHFQTGLVLREYAWALRFGKRANDAKAVEKRAARILNASGVDVSRLRVDVTSFAPKDRK